MRASYKLNSLKFQILSVFMNTTLQVVNKWLKKQTPRKKEGATI
jgi:hypothetical protein